MRGKPESCPKQHQMQKLLDKEQELETQVQRSQNNLELFEKYYLQNSWRTGNLFLGWPICSYSEITEFINRPRAKKNTKPYVEIEDHELLFSLSSITSRPFLNISKPNYLATKQLSIETRPKIYKGAKKGKVSGPNSLKFEKEPKLEVQSRMRPKVQEESFNEGAEAIVEVINSEDEFQSSASYQSVSGASNSQSEIDSHQSEQSQKIKSESKETINRVKEEPKTQNLKEIKEEERQPQSQRKHVTFFFENQRRTIPVPSLR